MLETNIDGSSEFTVTFAPFLNRKSNDDHLVKQHLVLDYLLYNSSGIWFLII